MEGDHPVWRPQRVGRTARPGVGGGRLREAGANGIPIEVPEGGEGVQVVFDETGPVAPLPEVAPAAAGPMEGLRALSAMN